MRKKIPTLHLIKQVERESTPKFFKVLLEAQNFPNIQVEISDHARLNSFDKLKKVEFYSLYFIFYIDC